MAFYTTTNKDQRPLYHKSLADAKKYAYEHVKDPNNFHPAVRIYNGKTGKEIAFISSTLDRHERPDVDVELKTDFSFSSKKMDKNGRIFGGTPKRDAFNFYAFTYADTGRRAVQGDFSMSMKDARAMAARLSVEKKRAIKLVAPFHWNGQTQNIPVATFKNGKVVRRS